MMIEISLKQYNDMAEHLTELEWKLGETVRGWIPCSERLPSENGRYLVTFPLLISQHTWIDILWYGNPTMPNRRVKGKCWYRTDDEWGDVVYDEVTAWMSLPTPYKGGDSE